MEETSMLISLGYICMFTYAMCIYITCTLRYTCIWKGQKCNAKCVSMVITFQLKLSAIHFLQRKGTHHPRQ